MLTRFLALRIIVLVVASLSLVSCSLVEKVKSLTPFSKARNQRSDLRLIIDRGHDADIMSIAFNPQGTVLASGSDDRTVKLWDVRSHCELRTIKTGFKVLAVAFSHDGSKIAVGSWKNPSKYRSTIQVWDATTGEPISEFQTDDSGIADLAFTSNDKAVAIACSPDDEKLKGGASVRFYDIESKDCIATFYGEKDYPTNGICFSPNGKLLAATTPGGFITLWNVATKKRLNDFNCRGDNAGNARITFGPDNQTLGLIVGTTLFVIDTENGKKKSIKLKGVASDPSVAISPDGTKIIGTTKEMVYMFRTADLKELLTKERMTKSVAFNPDGLSFATSRKDHISIYDSSDGERWYSLGLFGPPSPLHDYTFGADGRSIVTCEANAKLWDFTGKRNVHMFNYQEGTISPNGKLLAVGGHIQWERETNDIQIRDARTGLLIRTIKTADPVQVITFSSDSKLIFSGNEDYDKNQGLYGPSIAQTFDVATGKEVMRVTRSERSLNTPWLFDPVSDKAACATKTGIDIIDMRTGKTERTIHQTGDMFMSFADGGNMLAVGTAKEVSGYDLKNGTQIFRWTEPRIQPKFITSIALSPDGKTIALSNSKEDFTSILNVQDGDLLKKLPGLSGLLKFSPDGKLLGCADGRMVVLSKTSDWSEVVKLVPLALGEWVVVDPAGRFDSSKDGRRIIHFAKGTSFLSLDQLWDQFYEPNLLSKTSGFSSEPLRAAPPMTAIALAPEVEVDAPSRGSSNINIKIKKRDGGIGRIVIKVNGKELPEQAQPRALDIGLSEVNVRANLMRAASIDPGKTNRVSVVVYNKDGTMTSRDCELAWEAPDEDSQPNIQRPQLYAIICGTSTYKNPRLNLTFPAKDAADFKKSLEIGAPSLFGTDKVHITLLATDTDSASDTPTKSHIEAAFQAARKSRPEDVLVVYMAGHGVTVKEPADTYYYLLADADSPDLSNKQVRDKTTISSEELANWITTIPAKHQVMIFDTCGAGGLVKKLADRRDFSTDGIRAIEVLNRRAGTHVLLGCAADAVSYESNQYSQGLLTYALLEGMRTTKGLRKESAGFEQDVLTLFNYARDRVPELAQSMGGIQEPRVVAAPEGSFAIGLLRPEDTVKIPLARAKHRVTPPLLVDADQVDDTLDLSNLLSQRLNELSKASTRGISEPYVYIPDADLSDSIKIFGKYKVSGDKVSVTVNLKRNHEQLDKFTVEGTKTDVPQLVKELTDRIRATLRKKAA